MRSPSTRPGQPRSSSSSAGEHAELHRPAPCARRRRRSPAPRPASAPRSRSRASGRRRARPPLEAERQEGHEPGVGAEEADRARADSRLLEHDPLDELLSSATSSPARESRSAARGGSGRRRLDGTAARIAASSSSATSCASARLMPPGSLTCSDSSLRPSRSRSVTLWISRIAGTEAAAARARAGRSRSPGSTCTTTSLPGRARSTAASTASAAACPCPHRRGRDADHDVRELTAARLPHPQPAERDVWQAGDRLPRRLLRPARRAIHEDVDVDADQPGGARSTRTATSRAATGSPSG